MVRQQDIERGLAEHLDRLLAQAGTAREERFREQGNVFRPVAQRREMHGNHVQAIVQIGPEVAAFDLVLEVAVGRRDDPCVYGLRFGRTHWNHFTLLQNAQQLHLRGWCRFADFVEEERSPLGGREEPCFILDCAREGALDVSEQLTLQQ